MSADSCPGAYLRRCRERSGLSLEAVATGSRIVPRLVEALEADRHDLLPAPVYVRGFIRAYAEQVGADVEKALGLYDAQSIPDPPLTVRPAAPTPAPVPASGRWGRVAAGSVLAGAIVVTAVVLLARRQPDAVTDPRAGRTMIASRPLDPASPGASETPAGAVPAPPAAGPPGAPAERVLLMRAVDTTWVRVAPEGASPTEETLAPGTVREWRSAGRFHVTLGNAGGVEIELDGRALPALGQPGQVVRDATIPDERRP